MIVVTVFLLTMNQMEVHLVQNRKENCHHNHIPFNIKRNGKLVFSVQRDVQWTPTQGNYSSIVIDTVFRVNKNMMINTLKSKILIGF